MPCNYCKRSAASPTTMRRSHFAGKVKIHADQKTHTRIDNKERSIRGDNRSTEILNRVSNASRAHVYIN